MSRLRWVATALCLLLLTLGLRDASAAVHVYNLFNHPGGNKNPPPYGLRLDELGGLSGDFTFSFEEDGTGMFLEYDDMANTIRIHGRVFGGRDTGSDYDSTASGFWDVDFTYREDVSLATGAHDGLLVTPDPELSNPLTNNGTIKFVSGGDEFDPGDTFYLVDFRGGNTNSFLFLNDSHRLVSPDPSIFVGRGWLNHATSANSPDLESHVYSSDWLFTAEPVPEPASLAMWGLLSVVGLGAGLRVRRRARQSDCDSDRR